MVHIKGLQSRIIALVISCTFVFSACVLFYFEYELYNQAIHSGDNINRLIGSKYHVAMANYISNCKRVFHGFTEIRKTIGFAISLNNYDEIYEDLSRFMREPEFNEVIIITNTNKVLSNSSLTREQRNFLNSLNLSKSELSIQWNEKKQSYLFSEPLIVDDEYLGMIIAYMDFSRVKNLLREYSLLFLDYEIDDVVSFLKSKNFFIGEKINIRYLDLLNDFQGDGFFKHKNRYYISKVALPLPDGETGYIGCFVPEFQLMKDVYRIGFFSSTATFLLMLLSVLFLFYTVNKMLVPLQKSMELILKSSSNIGKISHENSSVSKKLFSMVKNQSQSIEETYVDMEKLVSISSENALLASKAKQVIHSANRMANHGEKQMKLVMNTMDKLLNFAKDTAEVVKIIKQIASQIDIVAINASIEAARAGTKGKEFAHVAKQVGELAQNSYLQSEKISFEIENTMKLLNDSYHSIFQEKLTLVNIVEQVDQASHLMNQIVIESKKQAEAIKDLIHVLSQLDDSTEENHLIAEKTSKGGKSLSEASLLLSEVAQTISNTLGVEVVKKVQKEEEKQENMS